MPRGIPTSGRALVLKPPVEPDPLESWHQEQIMHMAALNRHQWPELEWLHSIPNGGFRHKATAVAMERQGAKAGVSDLALDVARGGLRGPQAGTEAVSRRETDPEAEGVSGILPGAGVSRASLLGLARGLGRDYRLPEPAADVLMRKICV